MNIGSGLFKLWNIKSVKFDGAYQCTFVVFFVTTVKWRCNKFPCYRTS